MNYETLKKFVEDVNHGNADANREKMLCLLHDLKKTMKQTSIPDRQKRTMSEVPCEDVKNKRQCKVAVSGQMQEDNQTSEELISDVDSVVSKPQETDEETTCTDVVLYDARLANAIAVILENAELLLRKQDQCYVEQTQKAGVLHIGYVYVAKTKCLRGLYKIGATFRTAGQRIEELSRTSVPEPFMLVACVPTPDPFGLERKIHEYFAESRIHGKSTEFFKIKKQKILEYFHKLNQDLFKECVQ